MSVSASATRCRVAVTGSGRGVAFGMTGMTSGQLAACARVNTQTLRYYERRGLLPSPARTRTGYRQYPPEAADRLRFIKRAQDLGFSLSEIRELLTLRVRHVSACDSVKAKTVAKLDVVDQKLRELERMRRSLEQLVAACDAQRPTDDCPVLQMLEDTDDD